MENTFSPSYLDLAKKLDRVDLCIVGRDPYPYGAIPIPFCKSEWEDFKINTSGSMVLKSLLNVDNFTGYKPPKELFLSMLEERIVFLNASYKFLNKETLNRNKHINYIEKAYEENESIFRRSKDILLVNDAFKMMGWVIGNLEDHYPIEKVPHPSLQSRNRSIDKEKWDKYWSKGALNKMYNLDLNSLRN